MLAPKPRQPQQAIVNRKLHAKCVTHSTLPQNPDGSAGCVIDGVFKAFFELQASVRRKKTWSEQGYGPMFGHHVTKIRKANEDMMFIIEVRGRNWLDGKNLHMVCVEEFVFVTRGQFGIFLNPAVHKRLGSWRMQLDFGWRGTAMVGFARGDRGGQSYNLVVSHLPTVYAHGNTDSVSLLL